MASMEARLEALRLNNELVVGIDTEPLGEDARKSDDPYVVFAFAKQLLASDDRQAEGLKLCKMLATKGLGWIVKRPLSDAQFLIGDAYMNGLYGLKPKPKKAYHYFLQAAKQRHAESTFQVGQCHEKGIGCKRAPRRAVEYYRKAAALGDDKAMHRLALVLLYGQLGEKRSLKEGISWLKRAAGFSDETGNWAALYDLGRCYEECPVVIKDEAFARDCYRKAASEGDYGPAQFRLGKAYEFGQLGLDVSISKAIQWYSKAANSGHGQAQMAMSYWALKGFPDVMKPDAAAALAWAKLAADGEHKPVDPMAIYRLARFYEEGVGSENVDLKEAEKLYGQAAVLGHAKSKARLIALQKSNKKSRKTSSSNCMIQ